MRFPKLQNLRNWSDMCVIVQSLGEVHNNLFGLHRNVIHGTSYICCWVLFIIVTIFCEHNTKGKCLYDLLLLIRLHIHEASVYVIVICFVSNILILWNEDWYSKALLMCDFISSQKDGFCIHVYVCGILLYSVVVQNL
jgi:hypothetical protein